MKQNNQYDFRTKLLSTSGVKVLSIKKSRTPNSTKMVKSIQVIHWAPRIICILAILFVSMFALDAFAPDLTIWQQIGGFLIHLIPSFILIAALAVAWKWEFVGGFIFTILSIAFSIAVFLLNYNRNHFSFSQSLQIALIIAIPFALTGVLFIISHKIKEREQQPDSNKA